MRTKLREGERLIFQTSAHWITVVKPAIVFVLALVLLVLSFILLKDGGAARIVRPLCAALSIVGAGYFGYYEWFRRTDLWAVTNLRVVDEMGILKRYSKESPFDKINNLSYDQSLLGRMLGYGDVEIQTAAEDGATIYRKVAKPKQLKETIAHYRDEFPKEMEALHAKPAPPAAAAPPESGEPTRVCPFCAETIKAQAKVCRYCGRDLPPL
jgi:uncharacterized membrane protein YdbT with pleckstrin-like domain